MYRNRSRGVLSKADRSDRWRVVRLNRCASFVTLNLQRTRQSAIAVTVGWMDTASGRANQNACVTVFDSRT